MVKKLKKMADRKAAATLARADAVDTLAAGDAIVYPSTSLHRVAPVTAGQRVASFLWTQSLVRGAWQRAMLFDLDMTILKLRQQLGDSAELVALTGHYHKLLQQWAE